MAQSSRLLVASHLLRHAHNILFEKEKHPTVIMDRHFKFTSHEGRGWWMGWGGGACSGGGGCCGWVSCNV